MIWQDIVISGGQLILLIALLPSVFGSDKPAFSTSLTTGIVLIVFGVAFATLSLWYTAFSTFFISAVWFVLAIQKYTIAKKVTEINTGDVREKN